MSDKPSCGCIHYDDGLKADPAQCEFNTDGCLYPSLVTIHEQAEFRLASAESLIRDFLKAMAYTGSEPLAVRAEAFLKGESNVS